MSETSENIQTLLKDYHRNVKSDIKGMRENYLKILDLANSSLSESKENVENLKQMKDPTLKKVDGSGPTNTEQKSSYKTKTNMSHLEIQTKTNQIIKSAHSLLDLTSELKTLIIISDLSSQNLSKEEANKQLVERNGEIKSHLMDLKDNIYGDLYTLENGNEVSKVANQ